MEQCIICIEDSTPEHVVIELDFNQYPNVACECKIHVHVECWMQYILHKGRIECPICHKIFEQDAPQVQMNPVYQPIEIPVIYVRRPSDDTERLRRHCLFVAVIVIIFVPIIVFLRI